MKGSTRPNRPPTGTKGFGTKANPSDLSREGQSTHGVRKKRS